MIFRTIPDGWEIKKMPQVVKWGSGGTPKATEKQYYDGGSIPWLVIGDLNDSIVSSSASKITELGLQNSSAKMIPAGTLLVAMYGSIGKLGITGIECCTNQAIAYAKELYGVTTKYMFFYMAMIKSELISKGKGGTQKNISQTVLNSLEVIVPPLPEQERIVARIEELFSQLDAGVETLKKTKAQLAVYRQAVLKEAFEGKYTPDVTMHEIKMGEIADGKDGLRRGPFGSAIKKAFFVESGYKVYEQGNAINNDCKRGHYYISADKYNELSSFQLRPGDFIVSCSGTIGKIAQLPADAELGVINQALMRIRLKPDVIDPYYFMMQFRSEVFQRKIVSRGSGMGNLAGIKEFKLATMFIPENYENQKQIVAEIESRLSVCDSIEQTVDTTLQQAEDMRQSILKQAFKGEL